MSTAPEPGWYDDGTGKQRWWDGARWTEQFIDLRERTTELRTGAAPTAGTAPAGWHDDGQGRQRVWDGARWTDATRFSGSEESFADIVVDDRWIHFGTLSRPIAGAMASHESGTELLRRGRLSKPAIGRVLHGPHGPITPHLLKRSVDPNRNYLVVEVAGEVWLAAVPAGQDARSGQFATWIVAVSEHYRYR